MDGAPRRLPRRTQLAPVLMASLVGLVSATATAAHDVPKSLDWVETGGFDRADYSGLELTRRSILASALRQPGLGGATHAQSADVGDVWVVAANHELLYRYVNPLDLQPPITLRFVPQADGSSFAVEAKLPGPIGELTPDAGTDLGLGDDDTTEVSFPAGFPFFGTTYTSVWVNSDGNITLGRGDAASTRRDAYRHVDGPPRVSALLTDLNPDCGGAVRAAVHPDRLEVTWDQVVHYQRGVADGCGPSVPGTTVGAVLHVNGVIDLVYRRVDDNLIGRAGVNREAVIGVAEGGFRGPFSDVDYTRDLPGVFSAGAIFEAFRSSDPPQLPQVDLVRVAREFYRTHEDKYDFLVLFTDRPVTMDWPGAFALSYGVRNQTAGLNTGTFDFTAFLGSDGELESFLHMNVIDLYWPDAPKLVDPPIKMFSELCTARWARRGLCDRPPGPDQETQRARWFGTINGVGPFTLGLHSAMSLMAEEVGHRWMAHPTFRHPVTGVESDDLLGRDESHWSFFFNTRVPSDQFGGDPRSSSMAGNAIVDLGPDPGFCPQPGHRRFQHEPDELIDGYSQLDQYFMGLRSAAEVDPFWYVDEPHLPFAGGFPIDFFRVNPPLDDVSYCGKRADLAVADIQASIGERVPAIGDEVDQDRAGNDAADVKTMAFILLVSEGPPGSITNAAAIQRVDTFRRTWEAYANGPATGGLGRFDTSLDPETH